MKIIESSDDGILVEVTNTNEVKDGIFIIHRRYFIFDGYNKVYSLQVPENITTVKDARLYCFPEPNVVRQFHD